MSEESPEIIEDENQPSVVEQPAESSVEVGGEGAVVEEASPEPSVEAEESPGEDEAEQVGEVALSEAVEKPAVKVEVVEEEDEQDAKRPEEEASQSVQIDYMPDKDEVTGSASAEDIVGEADMNEVVAEGDEPDPREANRVDDVDKAHSMAIAGDEFRSRAAENRKNVIDEEQDIDAWQKARADYRKIREDEPSKLHPIARKKHEADLKEARKKAATDPFKKHNQKHKEGLATADEMSRLGHDSIFYTGQSQEPEVRAKVFDNRASELEEWAGILHDNPVRVSIADGLEVEVTPQMMMQLEDEAKEADVRLAELQQSDWMKSHREMDLREASGVSEKVLEELMPNADEETRDNINALVADLNKTDLELRAKLAQLREQAIIEPLIAENEVRNKSLADIRSGASKSED